MRDSRQTDVLRVHRLVQADACCRAAPMPRDHVAAVRCDVPGRRPPPPRARATATEPRPRSAVRRRRPARPRRGPRVLPRPAARRYEAGDTPGSGFRYPRRPARHCAPTVPRLAAWLDAPGTATTTRLVARSISARCSTACSRRGSASPGSQSSRLRRHPRLSIGSPIAGDMVRSSVGTRDDRDQSGIGAVGQAGRRTAPGSRRARWPSTTVSAGRRNRSGRGWPGCAGRRRAGRSRRPRRPSSTAPRPPRRARRRGSSGGRQGIARVVEPLVAERDDVGRVLWNRGSRGGSTGVHSPTARTGMPAASNDSPGATTVTRSEISGASSAIRRRATASMVSTGRVGTWRRWAGHVVVGVLVGDQHGVGAVHRIGVGEHPRVDHEWCGLSCLRCCTHGGGPEAPW